MTQITPSYNIADRLTALSKRQPFKRAVVAPSGKDKDGRITYAHLTFAQLEEESTAYARGFERIGIKRGVRTLLMVRPGLAFFTITFALFKTGAVPIFIDPGMGKKRLFECIKDVAPEALVAIPVAHIARILHPKPFRSVKQCVTVGKMLFWGGCTLSSVRTRAEGTFEKAATSPEDPAAILFTTGSTGPAKGVVYEHGMFAAQCDLIRKTYDIPADGIDLPTFPLFGLFSVALGMTAVIPDMDPTRPAEVDPEKIVEAINNQGCTFSFGSPALWKRVLRHCIDHDLKLPSLKRVLMAGAPIPGTIHADFQKILPRDSRTHTPYGATESLPATDIIGAEVCAETWEQTQAGKGVCVGRPVSGMTVEIIRLTDEPIKEWTDDLLLSPGEVGEITVRGPTVTKAYFNKPEQTKHAKIRDADGIWHRIGDLGYKDEKGRVWVCGRKTHRVETDAGILYTLCCEAVFNRHPQVKRSALVGIGRRPHQTPVIVVETEQRDATRSFLDALKNELLAAAAENQVTSTIAKVLFHPSFPVDIRHNAKIFREILTTWAEKKLAVS